MMQKIAMIGALIFAAGQVAAQDNPLAQMYRLLSQQDWGSGQLPGAVLAYQAPVIGGYGDGGLRDVDWGANSISFTMDLPHSDVLEAIYGRDIIELDCHQRSVAAIVENIAQIGDLNMPPRILQAAQASGSDAASYIRQCEGIARMRDIGQGRPSGTPALDLCANVSEALFGAVDITKTIRGDYDTPNIVVTEAIPVETPDGIALGFTCQQNSHPYSPMSFTAWYLG